MLTGIEPGAMLADVTLEIVAKAAKSPLTRLVSRFSGKKLLIVGPQESGKTSLAEYLRFGILADDEHGRPRSEDVETQSAFSLDTAHGQRISARFRYVKTLPGQLWPHVQAQNLRNRKPSLCLVMLDASKFTSQSTSAGGATQLGWFEDFADAVILQHARASEKTRLKVKMLVILNKVDKISPNVLTSARRQVQNVIEKTLSKRFSVHSKSFKVLPCCLVDQSNFSNKRDVVMRHILAELQ